MEKNLTALLTLIITTSTFCAIPDPWLSKKERIRQKIKLLALEERINETARQRGRLMQIRAYGSEFKQITLTLHTLEHKKQLLAQTLQYNQQKSPV